MKYQDIDWDRIWREGRAGKSWKKRGNSDWDKRAPSYAKRQVGTPYADRFVKMMNPQADWTVLDVGCGPGTLALPLAPLVKKITAVDFSAEMLNELQARCATQGITNVKSLQASWTDDWQAKNIPIHDVAIASRSMSVEDLGRALRKVNDWAAKKVFISDRVGSGPFDPELFKALGRNFEPGPDYIVTLNILYRMGIHPNVDYIHFERSKYFSSREDAVKGCHWMLDSLTAAEQLKLEAYVDERLRQNNDGMWVFTRRTPIKWAVISWEKK